MKPQKLWQQVLIATLLTLLSGLIFSLYLVLIGIPRTQARQLYLEAEQAINEQQTHKAVELLQHAAQTWPEDYIKSRLNALTEAN